MDPTLSLFYEKQEEPAKSCLYALRDIILDFDDRLKHVPKYGMPCFVLGKKHFCYLWTDKKNGYPYILIVEGMSIEHPLLETGDRKRMKIFRIDANEDIPVNTIHEIFNLAMKFYT